MNWGNRLLIVFIVFGTGMGYLVYRSTQTNFELVEKEYYKSELQHQQVIDAHNLAVALNTEVVIKNSTSGVQIVLPAEMKNQVITGTVWFYCAYKASNDRKFKLEPDKEAQQFFSATTIPAGKYTARISWNANAKAYYSEKEISVL